MHCVACFGHMRDTCPCRCCGPLWECEDCQGCSPCYGDECLQCQEEAAKEEVRTSLVGSLGLPVW